ncbi:RHS repeat-associated core domain-containing protein [Erwinia tasmaniensis]|uniref:Similar to the nematicidal protein 2 n=1 Tax=Erwinia tasmaniensis (strain DSM 17950 / CFBP 7177 / CIP 109463 / NCPPB 4357 / Et1/99) TaxID=465817 RepID=B2VBS7_ERWT9|nr:RHS repeat-associated core domain-containing protein [Erwinia tasmaniensis]CAO97328.1 Similar to the nematicidal protein 2 [Erwinia tasmaniensis Et1/99]
MKQEKKLNRHFSVNTQQDNFISACMAGVDPRTGFFTNSTTLFDYTSCFSDVRFSFVVNYNSKNRFSNQGYGYGFTDNLTRYNKKEKLLSLSAGQVYTISNDMTNGQPELVDCKYRDFTFYKKLVKDINGVVTQEIYFVKYVHGVLEKLENIDFSGDIQDCYVPSAIYYGVLSEVQLYWDYNGGLPQLVTVREIKAGIKSHADLLSFNYNDKDSIVMRVFSDTDSNYNIYLELNKKNNLIKIKNAGFDAFGENNWSFRYSNLTGEKNLLSQIRYPSGRKDTVQYRRSQNPSDLSISTDFSQYCVWLYRINPQFITGAKDIITNYTFKWNTLNKRYSSVENYLDSRRNIIKIITITYNNLHLLISESVENGEALVFSRYVYNHCDENKDLAHQPLAYQCITQIRTTLTDTRGSVVKQREEVVNMEYDNRGNLIKQINENKSYFHYLYLDEISHGSKKIRIPDGHKLIKSYSLFYPNQSDSHIRKEYKYDFHSGLSDDLESGDDVLKYKIVPVEESLYIDNVLINSMSLVYHDDINDIIQLGKIKSYSIASHDRITKKEFKWDYQHGTLSLQTKTEKLDTITFEIFKWSGVTGLLKSTSDMLKRKVDYVRDKIGRVVRVTLISNIDDPAKSKTFKYDYKYKVKDISGALYYEVETTDLYHNKYYERYDGLGRIQYVAFQKANHDSENIINAYKYNEISQLIYEETLSCQDKNNFSFLNVYSYDDWGNINNIRHDDGVEEHITSDVINRTKMHWMSDGKEITNKRSVTFDENNQPVIYKYFSSDGVFSYITLYRDFCGRLVSKKDELGRVTKYGYDVFDRVNVITLPDKSVITKSYNMYSAEPLIEKITFTSTEGEIYQSGTQIFDGLNRLKESQCYGVITKYSYSLNSPLPDQVSFADGSSITYKNDFGLRGKILSSADQDNKFRKEFTYSKIDDCLIEAKFITANDTYIEKINESPDSNSFEIETKFSHDKNSIDLVYRQENYPNNDRIHKIFDEKNNEYVYSHDSHGRLVEINADQFKTEVRYDKFSRISHIYESDEFIKSIIGIKYDEFSREIERKSTLHFSDRAPEITTAHSINLAVETTYFANNLIRSRILKKTEFNVEVIRHEHFTYDVLDRILNYRCTGEAPTTDKSGRGIVSIAYSYDRVGNILETSTVYADDSHVILRFYYDDINPFILRGVYNNSTLEYTEFYFNTMGHLLKKQITKSTTPELIKKRVFEYKYDNYFCLSSIQNTCLDNSQIMSKTTTSYKYNVSDNLLFTKHITDQKKVEEIMTFRGVNNEIVSLTNFRDKSQYKKKDSLFGETRKVSVFSQGDRFEKKMTSNGAGTPIYSVNFKNNQYEGSEMPGVNIYGGSPDKDTLVGLNGSFYDNNAQGYILGVRLYDPEYMRFSTPDSLSPFNGGNINPYIYCNNNPVNNNDNSGYLTNENWKVPIYLAASFSIITGIASLGASLAMSSVMMAVFSLLEIGTGILSLVSLNEDNDNSDLVMDGMISTAYLGISALYSSVSFKYPLSKTLKRFFDFKKNQQALRTLSYDRKKKEIMGLKYLGSGVTVFNDTYQNQPRLNIYSHGKKASLVETRFDESGKSLKVNKLDSLELDRLLRITGSINYDSYASIRIIACHSADFGFLTPALGQNMHQLTGLPVKAFQGVVTSFGYPPDILQSSFEKFAHDPHAMQNIRKQFSSRFELVHNANYSPRHFF